MESITTEECELTKNEVRVLAMLHHPNIIEYYENFLENHTMMIVMEYAPGGNLYDYLRCRGEGNLLQEEDVLHLFCQLVVGMKHIHECSILHRDIKSNNILLDRSHRIVKIGDFGISKILSSKSKAHSVVGTPCYLSPELCQEKPYNKKSDIWALGCVLYEMLTLRRAFEAETLPALIMKIMRGIFVPIHPQYSAEMRSLVHLLLHVDPGQRPNIHEIISNPLVFPTIFKLHADLGMVRCVSRPLRLSSVGTRTRSSRGSEDSTDREKQDADRSVFLEELSEKETATEATAAMQPSAVFCLDPCGNVCRLPLGHCEGNVCQVAASKTHKAAITNLGQVILWKPPTDSANLDNNDEVLLIPTILKSPSSVVIVQVACGEGFIACITDRGILMTSGSGASGSLGHGSTNDVSQLKIVESLLGVSIKQIACGTAHVIALSADHQVYTWGCGDNGRLGIGSRMMQLWPKLANVDDMLYQVVDVAAGEDCSLLTTSSGILLASGSNRMNKLCVDETDIAGFEILKQIEDVATFVPVCSRPLSNNKICKVAAGLDHTVFLTDAGEVFTSGKNTSGQLGHEGSQNPRVPTRVMEPVSHSHVVEVACGREFTVAVTKECRVYFWGGKGDDPESDQSNHSVREKIRPYLLDLPLNAERRVAIASSDSCVVLCNKF
ncbi:serine/threonine-protein kinase Nek8-like isoform X2 [Palaemon carinicauda]